MSAPPDNNWFVEVPSTREQIHHKVAERLSSRRTLYQKVDLLDLELFGKTLVIDGDLQSSEADEFIYHEALVHPALVCHHWPADVLVIGGGEGATLREVYRHKSVKKAVMVDLDRELVQLCAQKMSEFSDGAFDDPRTEIIFQDARGWLAESNHLFDVIIQDLTDPTSDSPSRSLFTVEYFQLVRDHLKPGGIFAMQASRSDFLFCRLHCAICNTLGMVFEKVRPYRAFVPSFYNAWGFITASERLDPRDLSPDRVNRRISELTTGGLRFYDGETHQGLFALPLSLRRKAVKSSEIITDREFIIPLDRSGYRDPV